MASLYSDIEQEEDAALEYGMPLPAVVSVSSGWPDWQVCRVQLLHCGVEVLSIHFPDSPFQHTG